MRPGAQAEARRWFEQARQDLDDAEFLTTSKRYNVACFLAQQAAEKVLKAFLFSRGAENVWGYSVGDLCEDAAQFEPAFVELSTRAAPLDSYYILTRYPDALPGGIPARAYSAEDASLALQRARAVIETVERHVGQAVGNEGHGPADPNPGDDTADSPSSRERR